MSETRPSRSTSRAHATAVAISPTTLATSHEIRDRGSAFVGYVYRATTADEARTVLTSYHVHAHEADDERQRQREHKDAGQEGESDDGSEVREPSRTYKHMDREKNKDMHGPYVMAAWRCMGIKPGRTGLGGPDDFAVVDGCEDGGERWAGGRVLEVMKREGVIDAVVVVRRWFGGTLLGPVRFTHIETCASEVCRRFRKIEEMDECVHTLRTLDDLLATLRTELAMVREGAGTQDSSGAAESPRTKPKVPDYHAMQDSLDLTKAKRLIHARECAIKATKILIEKCKTHT